ncbi:MAG: hypothetical protein HYY04_13545 [Chloroflexi bacterium]|nr:hypothetical protein [Chloroflexota bacterium]
MVVPESDPATTHPPVPAQLDLFARTADGMIAVDDKLQIIVANPAAQHLIGGDDAELVSRYQKVFAPFNVTTDFASEAARAYLVGQVVGNPLSQMTRQSPVEELKAAGFGTATHKDGQSVAGQGVWSDGTWRVVLTRALEVPDAEAPKFASGKNASVAVAIWNGANKEVGSRKQTSTFVTFAVGTQGVSFGQA